MAPSPEEKDSWRDERGFVLSKVSQIETSVQEVKLSMNGLAGELRSFAHTQQAENLKAAFRQSVIGALTVAVPAILAIVWWIILNWPTK